MHAVTSTNSISIPIGQPVSRRLGNTVKAQYSWVIVFVTFILSGLCFGGVGLVAGLLKPIAGELGLPRGDISMAYTVATVATAFAGVAFGRVADLYGVRVLVVLGSITIALSLMAVSQISAQWHLYAAYAMFGALGFGAIAIPMTATVTNWFTERRGIALGIATAGGAIGQGVIPYIATTIAVHVGWRDAYLIIGVAYLVIGLPLALLVRNPPKSEKPAVPASTPAGRQQSAAIGAREAVAWICTAVIFCCMCMAVPIMHVVALANDSGLSTEQSVRILAIVMLSGAAGRVIVGRFADRIGPLNTYILAAVGQTMTVFWFTQITEPIGLYVLGVVFGITFGGIMTSFLLTIRGLVPARIAATSISIVLLFGWAGMGFGAYMGGVLFDWTGSYATSFGVAAISGTINITILLLLAVRLRRLRPMPVGTLVRA